MKHKKRQVSSRILSLVLAMALMISNFTISVQAAEMQVVGEPVAYEQQVSEAGEQQLSETGETTKTDDTQSMESSESTEPAEESETQTEPTQAPENEETMTQEEETVPTVEEQLSEKEESVEAPQNTEDTTAEEEPETEESNENEPVKMEEDVAEEEPLMGEGVVEEQPAEGVSGTEYWGVQTEAKVYDDFENDIWLQYQQKEMQVGDTASLRPWRVEQIVSDVINNDVARPTFRFEVIYGDSISLDTTATDSKAVVTAEKPGTSVVKVTYDALEYKGKTWGAISDVNTAYAVYTVGETGKAEITVSEGLDKWRHYDTIYYNEGATVPYTFTVNTSGAESVKVTLNGLEIQGQGNTYTANLENRSNIIGIETKDADGNIKSLYRVVDARFINVNVENKSKPGETLRAGDTATVSFKGITMPVYKLATIYNPCFDSSWGGEATHVLYENEKLGTFKGKCSQWDLATNNDFDVKFSEAGTYTFNSSQGIYCEWWGSPLGTDITAEGSGEPNLNAPILKDYFSKLPSFSVNVEGAILVESVTLDQTELQMKAGETVQLKATVSPENAEDKTITWSSSKPETVTVDKEGNVKAVAEGKAVITAQAGDKKAECVVSVARAAGGEVGHVTVTIKDEQPIPEGENWPQPKGVILDQAKVPIYQDDSMMDVIERACNSNDIEILFNSNKTYISSIDGLAEFHKGSGSGWMGTLNNWFTNRGFADFTVENGKFGDGDVICLEYTLQYGQDLTDTEDTTAELKNLGITPGTLTPTYERNVYEYTLILPENTENITVLPESYNRFDEITIFADGTQYRSGAKIPVILGMEVQVHAENFSKTEKTYTVVVTNQAILDVENMIDAIGTVTLESFGKIEAAESAYSKLSDTQKALVKNYNVLENARAEYDKLKAEADKEEADKAAAAGVTKQIEEIGEVTLEKEEVVKAARSAYDALTEDQKAYVTEDTLKLLTDAEKRIEELKAEEEEAASNVENLIQAIGKVTLESLDKIEAAENAYNELTDTQKALVDNYDVLTAARAEYDKLKEAADKEEAEKAAAKVETLIEEIGEVTLESLGKIAAAEKAYDELTDTQKALVDNYDVLTAARAEYDKLKAAADKKEADQKAADGVTDLIDAIGDKVTLDSKDEIKAARDAYNALSDDQKALIDKETFTKLENAEKELKKLETENQNKPQSVKMLVNEKYGVKLEGEGLTSDMELEVTPIGKGNEDVEKMRKEIPSKKSIFRLYNIKLTQNGKEMELPSECTLSIPVGKDYNGKELTVLHCTDSKVEELKGKVAEGVVSVKVNSLDSFGVVIDTVANGSAGSGNNGNGGANGTGGNGNSGNGALRGTGVKTGDETPIMALLLMLVFSAGICGTIVYKKQRQQAR